jgi:hypothetical protein
VVFKAGKNGGNFILSVFFLVVVFSGEFLIFQKPVLLFLKIGSRHCANRAEMLCWFGVKRSKQRFIVKNKGSHNKSFKRTPLTRRRLTPALYKNTKSKDKTQFIWFWILIIFGFVGCSFE